jgi:hypothetical protein
MAVVVVVAAVYTAASAAVAVVFIASCALHTRSPLTTWGNQIHLLVSRHWRNYYYYYYRYRYHYL